MTAGSPAVGRALGAPDGSSRRRLHSMLDTVVRAPSTHTIARTPFTRRSLTELGFVVVSSFFAGIGMAFVAGLMALGVALAVTFIGLSALALGIRGARGFARLHRNLARGLLDEIIPEPDAFVARGGFLGWLQSALRDRVGWRAAAYIALKVPMSVAYVFFGFSLWWDAFACLVNPWVHDFNGTPAVFGVMRTVFTPGYLSLGSSGFPLYLGVELTGVALVFLAPWVVHLLVSVDKMLMRSLLGPDPVSLRVRTLEHQRTHTLDASAATLRRIERDLHDGTQAQLVALAMRLGLVKAKLDSGEALEVEELRTLVDEAHRGAKEAIVELRDLARGIHPPALDTGLEAALATLAARSTVPTDLSFTLFDRPTPAIEAIAYFCVAELLANVAQHASASRASIRCARNGDWLRLVVRDDGVGGAQLTRLGSTSSGLAGLVDRVRSVDGHLDIASPPHGPTVVTVDLPMHA